MDCVCVCVYNCIHTLVHWYIFKGIGSFFCPPLFFLCHFFPFTSSLIYIYIYIYIYLYIYISVFFLLVCVYISKLAILVKGEWKAPFSIATTPMYRGGRNSIPWIALLYS